MQLTPEDKLTLSCIKIHPTKVELEQLNALIPLIEDWEKQINNIIDRGIGPLFYTKLSLLPNSSFISSPQRAKLQQSYYKTLSRSTVLYDYFRKVMEAFASREIAVIALKGIYLSEWLYQDIGLRQFSDIDLLVKEEDGLKCLAILAELGYKTAASGSESISKLIDNQSEIVHYTPMLFNAVSIEIHIRLFPDSEKFELKVAELWKNAVPVTINNTPVHALNNYDLLIHLCLHLNKHFRGGHVQFTCFNDITNLLEKGAETMDWNIFIDKCNLYNCEDIVFKYIILVNKYMNAPVPEHIISNYSYLLIKADEILFIKYLNGHIGEFSAVPFHLKNLKNINSIADKIKYLLDIIFPEKAFMIQKYRLDPLPIAIGNLKGGKSSPLGVRGHFWWFWYPYRWWVGVKGLFRVISDPKRLKGMLRRSILKTK